MTGVRTTVVTGAGSGIGRAARELLESRGQRVIGVDLRDAEVVADLSQAQGRQLMVDEVTRMSEGRVDSVLAVAGVLGPHSSSVAVNYFGALATLKGLRPALGQGRAPRAVAVSSLASLTPWEPELLDLLEAGDEEAALARVAGLPGDRETVSAVYGVTKRGVNRWVRRQAPSREWAGAGIALNAIAPGVVDTPMMAESLATDEGRTRLETIAPMPLNGIADSREVALLLAWLASEENTHVTGQVVFIDGGCEAAQRGDGVW